LSHRTLIVVVAVVGLVIGCVATTALASGTTQDITSNWPALNALLNIGNILVTALFGVAAWFVRGIKAQIKRIADTLDDVVDWQIRWAKSAETNVVRQAMKQNEHERACVREHGKMGGRPDVPTLPDFEWPAPPKRRSADSKEF